MNRLEIMEQVVSCENCELHREVVAPVFATIPDGATIAVVGEAPDELEDDQGRPFIGPAGQLLRRALAEAGIDPDQVAYINTISCWPHGTPGWDNLTACAPNKTAQLTLAAPRFVIPVGVAAVKGFRPWLDLKHGRARPWVQDGYAFAATYSPAVALRNGNYEAELEADLQTIAKMIAADDGQPWDEWPSWLSPFIPDTCSGCTGDPIFLDADGLGWCETHLPDHMQPRLAAYKERIS